MEADLDFSDEDLPESLSERMRPEIEVLISEISEHLNDNRRGERLRNGIQIAVIGAPNAGKSSLVNALAKREAAIVSEFAGTTRDVIEVHLDLGGYPVIIADTAGLRPEQLGEDAQGSIEREGIRRAIKKAEEADIRLLLFDGQLLPELDEHTLALQDEHSLLAVNKIDTGSCAIPAELKSRAMLISAKTGEGLSELVNALIGSVSEMIGTRESPALTRTRHRKNLESCVENLQRSLYAELPELTAEDIRLAIRDIGKITGRVDVEELLDVIFRDFCIGK
jgi:tRNA modification GTPase